MDSRLPGIKQSLQTYEKKTISSTGGRGQGVTSFSVWVDELSVRCGATTLVLLRCGVAYGERTKPRDT